MSPDDLVRGPAGQLRALGRIVTSLLLDRGKAKGTSRAKGLDVDQVRQHLGRKTQLGVRCTRSRAGTKRNTLVTTTSCPEYGEKLDLAKPPSLRI
jgi:hypothetical protein